MQNLRVLGGAIAVPVRLSGCVARRWDGCAIAGAVIGGVGAGFAANQAVGSLHDENAALVAGGALAVGLGESRPIAPNENPDGGDNPLGRAKNRRTECRVR